MNPNKMVIPKLSGLKNVNPCCLNPENLKVLDISAFNESLYYKCLKCSFIIKEVLN